MATEETLPPDDRLHYEERFLLPDEARKVIAHTVGQDFPGLRLFVRTAIAEKVLPITKVAAYQMIRAIELSSESAKVIIRVEFDGDGHYAILEGAQ